MQVVELGYCPCCGNEALLDDFYGWCVACIADETGKRVCGTCNARIIHESETICKNCLRERQILSGQNIDREIKRLMDENNITYKQARRLYYESRRPNCRCCGNPILHGKDNAKFCKSTPECIEAGNRYASLRRRWNNGYQRTEEEAVRAAINGVRVAVVELDLSRNH